MGRQGLGPSPFSEMSKKCSQSETCALSSQLTPNPSSPVSLVVPLNVSIHIPINLFQHTVDIISAFNFHFPFFMKTKH